jgi:hypothetical protein
MTSHPEPPSTVHDPAREVQQRLRLDERKKALAAVAVFALCLLLTAFFFTLNAIVLVRSTPHPYRLDMDFPGGIPHGTAYDIELRWVQDDSDSFIQRPSVFVTYEGRNVDESPLTPGQSIPVQLGQQLGIHVLVHGNVPSGLHKGEVHLIRREGPESLRNVVLPVEISVENRPWSNWFLLRNWLLLVMVVGAIAYLICVLVFSRPHGRLVITRFDNTVPIGDGSSERAGRVVPLKMNCSAWLFPWRRSVVEFSSVLRRVEPQASQGIRGEIWFSGKAMPPTLFLREAPEETVFVRPFSSATPGKADLFKAGPVEVLFEETQVLLKGQDDVWVSIVFDRQSNVSLGLL